MTTKTFDCVAMKRSIQERLNRETAGMTPKQRDAFVTQRAIEFLRRIAAQPGKGAFTPLFEALEIEREKKGNL